MLANVTVVSKRAEAVSGSFDWVTSRAVSWEEIEKVAFNLGPKVAFLGTESTKVVDYRGFRALPLPWDEHRSLIMVSRETL